MAKAPAKKTAKKINVPDNLPYQDAPMPTAPDKAAAKAVVAEAVVVKTPRPEKQTKTYQSKREAILLPQTQEQKQAKDQIIASFQATMEKYERANLPALLASHDINVAQFKHVVINELKRSEKLQQAFLQNPMSLFAAIIHGAEIGLVPSELLGQYFLIPRRDKKTGILNVKGMIGYKGMVQILLRGGKIEDVSAECVYKCDDFTEVLGGKPDIIHKPNRNGERNNKTLEKVYVIAFLANGRKSFKVMTKADIQAIADMQEYDNDLYFNEKKDPENWMAKKTVLMQLSKTLPKDFHGTKAISTEAALDGGAVMVLDENNQVKLVHNSILKKKIPKRFKNIYDTFLNQNEDDDSQE